MEDLVRQLNTMTLASRLKRLGDRLKSEATRVYRAHGIDFNDSWFLVAVALSRTRQATVTELAQWLNVSHAAVSQMVSAMETKGLVSSSPDASDRRRNPVRLTPAGRDTVTALEPLWQTIGQCTAELLEHGGEDLLNAVTVLEDRLESRRFFDRVADRIAPTHT